MEVVWKLYGEDLPVSGILKISEQQELERSGVRGTPGIERDISVADSYISHTSLSFVSEPSWAHIWEELE